ncbi:hypothetical protein LO763_23575 [Glycomyces sp. A-F 0318]|uniref:hypothetical protein n=1 Tax=Glycomyces amatae TaxID=2881355 RepID=UPI001E3703E4|nr:hypothetical protein [Glycomyces amatae]MCD0446603.1 hypothetical protein [Glycomyces amatae]
MRRPLALAAPAATPVGTVTACGGGDRDRLGIRSGPEFAKPRGAVWKEIRAAGQGAGPAAEADR